MIKFGDERDKKYVFLNGDVELFSFSLEANTLKISEILNRNIGLFPYTLRKTTEQRFMYWCKGRILDVTRINSKLLIKSLGLCVDNPLGIILFNKGLSMLDNFWLKEIDSTLVYKYVNLRNTEVNKDISQMSLTGIIRDIPKVYNHELTNIGSFNKCWVNIEGIWYLKKKDYLML